MAKDKLSPAGDTVKVVRLGGEMYRVRTHVTVEKIPETEMASMGEAQPQPDGSFELLLSEKDGESIDRSEQAILNTAWPAMRAALQEHLGTVSKKKRRAR